MQISLGKQLACQTDAFIFILDRHLFTAHLTGPVTAVSHNLHAAYAATPAPATYRNTLTAELFHRLEDVTLCRAGEFLTGIFNNNYKSICHRAHRGHRVIIKPIV